MLRLVLRVATLVAIAALPCAAQRDGRPGPAVTDSTTAAAVAGKYEFSFVPANGEPITGQLEITAKNNQFSGIFTSPKFAGPLDADFVRVSGAHVYTSTFGGGYTLRFDINPSRINSAEFTKTVRGQTERGPLSIKKVR